MSFKPTYEELKSIIDEGGVKQILVEDEGGLQEAVNTFEDAFTSPVFPDGLVWRDVEIAVMMENGDVSTFTMTEHNYKQALEEGLINPDEKIDHASLEIAAKRGEGWKFVIGEKTKPYNEYAGVVGQTYYPMNEPKTASYFTLRNPATGESESYFTASKEFLAGKSDGFFENKTNVGAGAEERIEKQKAEYIEGYKHAMANEKGMSSYELRMAILNGDINKENVGNIVPVISANTVGSDAKVEYYLKPQGVTMDGFMSSLGENLMTAVAEEVAEYAATQVFKTAGGPIVVAANLTAGSFRYGKIKEASGIESLKLEIEDLPEKEAAVFELLTDNISGTIAEDAILDMASRVIPGFVPGMKGVKPDKLEGGGTIVAGLINKTGSKIKDAAIGASITSKVFTGSETENYLGNYAENINYSAPESVQSTVFIPEQHLPAKNITESTPNLDNAANLDQYLEKGNSLKYGDTGQEVKELQAKLVESGYLEVGSTTGKYDDITKAAVEKFQTDKGITIDGQYGPMTDAAFQIIEAKKVHQAAAADKIFTDSERVEMKKELEGANESWDKYKDNAEFREALGRDYAVALQIAENANKSGVILADSSSQDKNVKTSYSMIDKSEKDRDNFRS